MGDVGTFKLHSGSATPTDVHLIATGTSPRWSCVKIKTQNSAKAWYTSGFAISKYSRQPKLFKVHTQLRDVSLYMVESGFSSGAQLLSCVVTPITNELSSCWNGRPFGHNRHKSKIGGGMLCPFPWGGAGSPSNSVVWVEAYLCTKWHLDPSNHLATICQHYRQTGQWSRSIGRIVTCNGLQKHSIHWSIWPQNTNVRHMCTTYRISQTEVTTDG